jgi:hypothetical protein
MAEMKPLQKGRDGLMIVRITLYTVAALLLAAYFLRRAISSRRWRVLPVMSLVRQRWSLLLLQGLAYVAAAIWLATAWRVVAIRWSLGSTLLPSSRSA